ncbi:hypothetical protein L6164_015348 [Bauhinia variegata]|uniref:Uncharacterized protein n=1 Tax=Bauhinia variegata TaxID=167791 RepID=A0ACB9NL13_BAUVA|nr:hypothetical protein L6164_015348 [Bauhinia variegata]
MGSLMAGWDCPTLDPKSARLQRNRSLTKEEIDAYWKSKKEKEEEHLRAISTLSDTLLREHARRHVDAENKFNKSSAINLTHIRENSAVVNLDTNLEEFIKKNGWWTKSSWAFLNEPPAMEAASNKYAAQFNVANLATAKFNGAGDGISAS